MRVLIAAGVIIAISTGTAFASDKKFPAEIELEQKAKDAKEAEKAYDKVMKNTGGKKSSLAPADPWENARSVSPSNSKKTD